MNWTTRPGRPALSVITAALFLFLAGAAQVATAAKAVDQGTEADDVQTYFGTGGNDTIEQWGYGGNDTQYAATDDGADKIKQYGGTGNDQTTALAGPGNDRVYQYGEDGDDAISLDAGPGADKVKQDGGLGNDTVTTLGGEDNDTLNIRGGGGDDTLNADGGEGDDSIKLYGDAGVDTISYQVSAGTDSVYIDGGADADSISVQAAETDSFTVVDKRGNILYQQGAGGTTIIVRDPEDLMPIGDENTPPVAEAGPDQTALVGATATLDGSGSSDADGDPLTFAWTLSPPTGSTALLSDPTAVSPTFVIDLPGAYAAELIVNDGQADSQPDTVTVSTENQPPVAEAGPDQTALVGDTVTLDGSGSSDPDGDPLTYSWTLTAPTGSAAALSDSTAVDPSFTIDLPGTYSAQLTVNDGLADSAPDTVTVSTENSPPLADAGPDQLAYVGDTVTLDGSASSDLEGDPLTYAWTLTPPEGSTAVLSDPTAVMPTFVIDVKDTYVAELVVNDGIADSAPDSTRITVGNRAPVAEAGPDQIECESRMHLDALASYDPDGDPLAYYWSFVSIPPGSEVRLSDPAYYGPDFYPDAIGDYVLELTVSDGQLESAADSVTYSVAAPPLDFGSAHYKNIDYPTSLEEDGARHIAVGPMLGDHRDWECDGYALDQDNGVRLIDRVIAGQTARIEVIASEPGILNAWIDLQFDGSWSDPDDHFDHVIQNQHLVAGSNVVQIDLSDPGMEIWRGTPYARFRLTSLTGTGGDSPTGVASDGEVEDYKIYLEPEYVSLDADFGDAPAPYPTLEYNDGARHHITLAYTDEGWDEDWRLGSVLDFEPDGQPTEDADGDDTNGWYADEDGVTFVGRLMPGLRAPVDIRCGCPSFDIDVVPSAVYACGSFRTLNAWIDFNSDGDWDDPDEQVATNLTDDCSQTLWVDIPASAASGDDTYARFRLTTATQIGGEAPTGAAEDGEVEDYLVHIHPTPVVSEQKVFPSDPAQSDSFGEAVAVDGDFAVIGVPDDCDAGIGCSGSAYVFVRSAGVWSEQQKLIAGDAAPQPWFFGAMFGSSVAISGDTIVIGAQGDDAAAIWGGAAYVFTRTDGTWSQQAKLTAADIETADSFGHSVSVSGDTALIGAIGDDPGNGTSSGSVYVFTRTDGVWSQQAKLSASDAAATDQFGWSVSISGDTALVGSRLNDAAATDSGSAYVFTRTDGVWSQQAKLNASDGDAEDDFGRSVSLFGDTAMIGAPCQGEDDACSGAVYVYERSASVWTEQTKLTADNLAEGARFGHAVAISGDTALISTANMATAAYVFTRTDSDWEQLARLNPYGRAFVPSYSGVNHLSISGDTLLIGMTEDSWDWLYSFSGSAYFYELK